LTLASETPEEKCRRLEAALRESEHRYQVLVEHNPDPVIVHRDGVIVFANPATARAWGATGADDLVGLDLRLLVHPDDREIAEARLLEAGAGRSVPLMELRLCHPADGRTIVVESQAEPIHYLGAPAVMVVARDITERRRAEVSRLQLQSQFAQAQKMEAIGRMAGGIAHDFNNMLTVILAATEMAQAAVGEDSPAQEELNTVREAALRSAEFARQLLAFSRRSAGTPRPVDLTATLQNSVRMLRRLLGEAVQFDLAMSESPWNVYLDPGRLDQILANLAVNGRDATAGHGNLELRVANVTLLAGAGPKSLPPGQYVRLEFSDDGCGMDEATRARIFEPFFTTKPVGVGTGLGLATVREIIDEMAGAIDVATAPGEGTCFTLYLPRHTESGRQSAPVPPVQPLPARANPGARSPVILVVEDDAAALGVVGELLRRSGYDVLTAQSPTAALGLFKARNGKVDLLITDVIMPTQDGDQLARQLVRQTPGLPVLYMSGYPPDILADRLEATPGAGFLSKPFTPTMLHAQVRRLLESRAPRRA
jgi:two-component system cell cycle sensor histidine kinase/response regulator CckA